MSKPRSGKNSPDNATAIPTTLAKWEAYLARWIRRTVGLGIDLALSVASVTPFLDGHSLHSHWEFGKYLIYVSCTMLTLFVGAAALTYNFWGQVRLLRKDARHG
jgi:hypothetical protein